MTVKMNKIMDLQDSQHELCMKAYYNMNPSVCRTTNVCPSKQEIFDSMLKSIGKRKKYKLSGTYHHVFVIPPTIKYDHYGIVTFSSPDVIRAIMFASDVLNARDVDIRDTTSNADNPRVYHVMCPNSSSVNVITDEFHSFTFSGDADNPNQGYLNCIESRGYHSSIRKQGLIQYAHGNLNVTGNVREDFVNGVPFIRMWNYHESVYQKKGYQYFGYQAPLAYEMVRAYLKTNKFFVKKALKNYSDYADSIILQRFREQEVIMRLYDG